MSKAKRDDLRFVIIGGGMAGILSAVKLREAGFENFTIYEKSDGLGGTWRANTYPGLQCDVPSHFYSYSFAMNPDWSRRYSGGVEIREYFENVARHHGVDSRVLFGKEIGKADFVDGRWHLETTDGDRDVCDFVIAATGVLHHPNVPQFEGADSFQGAIFHSADWNHQVPIAGKRIGVVGTGSSAVQICSAIVDAVGHLDLFQRTPQWIMPTENPAYSKEEQEEFRARPGLMEESRAEVAKAFTDGFANILSDAKSPILQMTHDMCVAHLETVVTDPELREKLRPDYRAGCKRLVLAEGFYQALQEPNVSVVTEGIERLEPTGVRTTDGTFHELDVLVLATGFRVDQFVRPMEVRGQNGVELNAVWQESPSAYMAIAVPEFPNFFMLNGPNGPVGNFSLIDVVEMQFAYIMQLIDQVREGHCRAIAPSKEAMAQFDEERKHAAAKTIWGTGCKSWYLDANGLPTAWPWTFDRFREEMAKPKLEHYDLQSI
jgi:cation diffusion facilitator CzcD-associated flavoprotein CzcO